MINDAFALAQAGDLSTTQPFEIIKYLSDETEYLPWSATFSRLRYYTDMLDLTSANGNYQNYLVKLIKPLYERLGWEEKPTDSWLDRLLRTTAISFACTRGVDACVTKAKALYAEWMANEAVNK